MRIIRIEIKLPNHETWSDEQILADMRRMLSEHYPSLRAAIGVKKEDKRNHLKRTNR